MDSNDVGSFYTTTGKDIWMMVSYCHEPSVTMENLETNEKVGGAIGCLNLKPFIKLVPEKDIK